MLPVDFTSQFLGVLELSIASALSSGEGFPDVLLLLLGLESQCGGGCVGVCYSILWTSFCV